jgi:hypothetical protein
MARCSTKQCFWASRGVAVGGACAVAVVFHSLAQTISSSLWVIAATRICTPVIAIVPYCVGLWQLLCVVCCLAMYP